jgi:hypothetical protein
MIFPERAFPKRDALFDFADKKNFIKNHIFFCVSKKSIIFAALLPYSTFG